MSRGRQRWVAAWGVLGLAATFVEAIVRLGTRAHAELVGGLSIAHWGALAVLTVLMTYVEGYRALQRRFVPSVVTRATEPRICDRTSWAMLAPLYAISLIGAPLRVVARTVLGIVMIVICVIGVRMLPAPWRGIFDAAVASALTWGLVCLLAGFAVATMADRQRRALTTDSAVRDEAV